MDLVAITRHPTLLKCRFLYKFGYLVLHSLFDLRKSCTLIPPPSPSLSQIKHMKKFIEQEAREKAEEIMIKVLD